MQHPSRRRPSSVALLLALLLISPLASRAAAGRPAAAAPSVAQVQELLDAGRAEEALRALEPLLRAEPKNAAALLQRSTAEFLLGDVAKGSADLQLALQIDPRQRQGWLNLVALRLSEKKYDEAYAAMLRARDLAPQAPENDLNLGAIELLQGRLPDAAAHFESYLRHNAGSGDASYLVATNYAMAGYAALATQHLQRAIAIDERERLRARTDPNFSALASHPPFQRLLDTDSYVPPPGSYQARRVYGVPYDAADGRLLEAVLDALQLGKQPFDPQVEVTPAWALVRGEMRIKLTPSPEGGVVELTAPPERLTPVEWQARSERLLRDIATRLAIRGVHEDLPPATPKP